MRALSEEEGKEEYFTFVKVISTLYATLFPNEVPSGVQVAIQGALWLFLCAEKIIPLVFSRY